MGKEWAMHWTMQRALQWAMHWVMLWALQWASDVCRGGVRPQDCGRHALVHLAPLIKMAGVNKF